MIGATLLASIPSPSANSISIGPLSLNAYGLMIAIGVIVAVGLLGRQLESKGLGTADDASSIAMWGVAAGIIGARLYHVATDWDRFSGNLGEIPKIWAGGLGIPGGLLAGVAVGVIQGRRRGIQPAYLLTCAAPAVPLAQAIGRWGNWFNQELYGKATDLPWGLEIDDAHNLDFPAGTTFHPTFLYESLWNLGLVAVLLWIDRKFRLGPGRLFAVYVMGYGIGRYWVEALRIDPVELSDVGGLRWNQWVALAAIVGGAMYLVATRGRRWPDPVDDEITYDEITDDEIIDDVGSGEVVDGGDAADGDAGDGDGDAGGGDVRTRGPALD
jgi:phosphatidylglycerol---prolipoprotein diacylglyceryl transferase